ncbi:unnamed protein product [Agarophyton chilense]
MYLASWHPTRNHRNAEVVEYYIPPSLSANHGGRKKRLYAVGRVFRVLIVITNSSPPDQLLQFSTAFCSSPLFSSISRDGSNAGSNPFQPSSEDVPSGAPSNTAGYASQPTAQLGPYRSFSTPYTGFRSVPLPQPTVAPMPNAAYVASAGVIRSPSRRFQRSYPPPAYFYGRYPLYNVELFAQAPWFDPVAIRDDALIQQYVRGGYFPDGIPEHAIYSDDWASHIALPDNAIARYSTETLSEAPRTDGEGYSYIETLVEVDVSGWRGVRGVRDAALCFQQPLLRAEFRFLRKRDIPYRDYPGWERRTRSRLGYLVPYQMIEIDRIRRNARLGRYIRIPEHWAAIESPRGCPVKLPPAISYIGSALVNNPFSEYWKVVYTEFIAKMAVFLLVDWFGVPADQSARGTRAIHHDHSPGRTASAGDFVWYDPWTRQLITSEQARFLRENPRDMPPNQLTGYVYDATPSENGEEPYEEAPGAEAELGYEDEPELAGVATSVDQSAAAGVAQENFHGFTQQPSAVPVEDPGLDPLRQFPLDAGFPVDQVEGDRAQLLANLRARTSL